MLELHQNIGDNNESKYSQKALNHYIPDIGVSIS
jgi:hypothetical protein